MHNFSVVSIILDLVIGVVAGVVSNLIIIALYHRQSLMSKVSQMLKR